MSSNKSSSTDFIIKSMGVALVIAMIGLIVLAAIALINEGNKSPTANTEPAPVYTMSNIEPQPEPEMPMEPKAP